jgi:uncharacterized membrane protein
MDPFKIATEDDFHDGPAWSSYVFPILLGLVTYAVARLHIDSSSNFEQNQEKRTRQERARQQLTDFVFLGTCAFILGSVVLSLSTAFYSQVTSIPNNAKLQNASVVVNSLESYRTILLEKCNRLEKELSENKSIANDPLVKVELETELRVDSKNLAFVEEQLSAAKAKKDELELFLATNQDKPLIKEYKKLRFENAQMSRALKDLVSAVQDIKEQLKAMKGGATLKPNV